MHSTCQLHGFVTVLCIVQKQDVNAQGHSLGSQGHGADGSGQDMDAQLLSATKAREEAEKLCREHKQMLARAQKENQKLERALAGERKARMEVEEKLGEALDGLSKQSEEHRKAIASEVKARSELEETMRGAIDEWMRQAEEHKRVLGDERRAHMEIEAGLRRELEERAVQVDEQRRKVQSLQQDVQRERSARGALECHVRQVEQELQREGSARAGAEQQVCKELHNQGLDVATVTTASYAEIVTATGQFSKRRILGRGGFGPVYAGRWRGMDCAIKVMDATESRQGVKEFLNEVNVLGACQHANVLPMLGFCSSMEKDGLVCALIYPRMEISLEDVLHRGRRPRAGTRVLTAEQRVVIAMDAASGLAYLHSSTHKRAMLHADVKSSNILLDAENRACLADVSLVPPLKAGSMHAGTAGYTEKSYLLTGQFTAGCDVFSLGVVFLELLTGDAAMDSKKRPPLLYERVAARLPHDATAVADRVAGWQAPAVGQFAGVAKDCISREASGRPTCEEVVTRLSRLVVGHEGAAASGRREGAAGRREQEPTAAKECLICMDATRRTRLRPCCHVVFCEGCAEQARIKKQHCPMCDSHVEDYDVGDFNITYVPV
jgi:hypothetical protein